MTAKMKTAGSVQSGVMLEANGKRAVVLTMHPNQYGDKWFAVAGPDGIHTALDFEPITDWAKAWAFAKKLLDG